MTAWNSSIDTNQLFAEANLYQGDYPVVTFEVATGLNERQTRILTAEHVEGHGHGPDCYLIREFVVTNRKPIFSIIRKRKVKQRLVATVLTPAEVMEVMDAHAASDTFDPAAA